MKRIISNSILVVLILLTGCSGRMPEANMANKDTADAAENVRGENVINTDVTEKITPAERAEALYERIVELFGIKGQNLFLEHYPSLESDRAVSYLWPFSGMLSAVNALGKLEGGKDKYNGSLQCVMAGLEKYMDGLRQPAAYQSYPFDFGGDDRFYDDNLWLGLDFIDAYELTEDGRYLKKAEDIFEFILSGWSGELGGGIYWCEQKKESKNTCSNGPAAVLALRLYEITGDKGYFDWGMKIYQWTRLNLQSPEGVYWDNINLQGAVDKTAYAYNSGTMLNAAVLLYRITGDGEYLKEARRVAEASFDHFAPVRRDGRRFFPAENPWFTLILFRGYQALYEVDRESAYIMTIAENVDYAWSHARDRNGLISRDWSGERSDVGESKWLLDEACMVVFYADIARWEGGADSPDAD